MTTDFQRGSAKIYQFPLGGRAAVGVRRDEFKPAAQLASPHVANIASGDAWYHEEAVREAELPCKN